MKINYHHKTFRSVSNTDNGEVDAKTTFRYRQQGDVVFADYEGGGILKGNLIAKILEDGSLDMRYQHLNQQYEFMTGKCTSTPEIMKDGRIRLHESWEWTSGDYSSGESIIEEVE